MECIAERSCDRGYCDLDLTATKLASCFVLSVTTISESSPNSKDRDATLSLGQESHVVFKRELRNSIYVFLVSEDRTIYSSPFIMG